MSGIIEFIKGTFIMPDPSTPSEELLVRALIYQNIAIILGGIAIVLIGIGLLIHFGQQSRKRY